MISRLAHEGIPVSSLRQINRLPSEAKRALYRPLIPERALLERCAGSGECSSLLATEIQCQEGTGVLEIDVRYRPAPQDPVLHVQMADTANGQLEVKTVSLSRRWPITMPSPLSGRALRT